MKIQSQRLLLCLLLLSLLTGVFSIPVSAAMGTGSQSSPEPESVTAAGWNSHDSFITTGTETSVTINAASLTWKKVNGKLRISDSNGKYKKGFVKYNGKLYYFDKYGNLKTGFFTVGKRKYYASTKKGYKGKGQILTGLIRIGKYFYYLNPSSKPYAGVIATGFRKINGRIYYFNSKGRMVTGWFRVSGSRYYASCNKKGRYGALLTGAQTIGGKSYRFSTVNGKLIASLSSSSGYIRAIDVSEHQGGSVDFKKVKASGVKLVIIRAGYGSSTVDKHFYSNIKKAKAAGLKIGIYWFSYAYNKTMAVNEAKFCLRVIKKYHINMPVYFDWEYDSMTKANRKGHYPGRKEITDMTYAFCNTIVNGGRRAGYYFNLHYLNTYYTPSKLTRFSTWYAYWGSNSYADNIWTRTKSMTTPTKYDMWQFSSRGRIPGISGNVDCDLLLHTSILK